MSPQRPARQRVCVSWSMGTCWLFTVSCRVTSVAVMGVCWLNSVSLSVSDVAACPWRINFSSSHRLTVASHRPPLPSPRHPSPHHPSPRPSSPLTLPPIANTRPQTWLHLLVWAPLAPVTLVPGRPHPLAGSLQPAPLGDRHPPRHKPDPPRCTPALEAQPVCTPAVWMETTTTAPTTTTAASWCPL